MKGCVLRHGADNCSRRTWFLQQVGLVSHLSVSLRTGSTAYILTVVDESAAVPMSYQHDATAPGDFDGATSVPVHVSTQEVLVTLSDGSQSILSIPAGAQIPSSSAPTSAATITGPLDQWFAPVQVCER